MKPEKKENIILNEMMTLEELNEKSPEELMKIVEEYRKYFQNGPKRK